jgi:hypothetical protein
MNTNYLVGNLNGRDFLGYLLFVRKIILKWIIRIRIWGCGLSSSGLEYDPEASFNGDGNETPSLMQESNFLNI